MHLPTRATAATTPHFRLVYSIVSESPLRYTARKPTYVRHGLIAELQAHDYIIYLKTVENDSLLSLHDIPGAEAPDGSPFVWATGVYDICSMYLLI
jgi:hypothetical protein